MMKMHQLAFVDPGLPDVAILLNNLEPGVEAVVLDPREPVPGQIAAVLERRPPPSTIHILAHGRPGEVSFSAGALDLASLPDHAEDLARIGRALDGGGLHLWSCRTAQGDEGQGFTEALTAAAGVPVAASTGLVGAAALGGCWTLDVRTREGRAEVPLTRSGIEAYAAVLETRTWVSTEPSAAWEDPANWDPPGVPQDGDDVIVDAPDSVVVIQSATAILASLDVSSQVSLDGATLDVSGGSGITVNATGSLTGNGTVDGDISSTGTISASGGTLAIAGTVMNDGSVLVDTTVLSATAALSGAVLDNDGGQLAITGDAAHQAMVSLSSAAGLGVDGVISGDVALTGNALLQFAHGTIGTIDSLASLRLDGALASVETLDAAGLNGALADLSWNAGSLGLANGATVVTAVDLENHGVISVSGDCGEGGSALTIGGAMTNYYSVLVGNCSLTGSATLSAASIDNDGGLLSIVGNGANQAAVILDSSAGLCTVDGLLDGDVELIGNALLQFATGTIDTIESGATLSLDGAEARIASLASGSLSTNSALTGLSFVDGSFVLADGASVTTDAGVDLYNSGVIAIDLLPGQGGSTLTIGGTVFNGGLVAIGNTDLSAATTLSAAAIDNSFGSLLIVGGTDYQAKVSLDSAAGLCAVAGELDGDVALSGDALLEFATGSIDTIESYGSLWLDGAQARINAADAGDDNSALTGLVLNEGGFRLGNGASVSTDGDLENDASGGIFVDAFLGEGGSSLAIGGTLTNSGEVDVGNDMAPGPTMLSAAAFDNQDDGLLSIIGSDDGQATVSLASQAGLGTVGVVTGSVELRGNALLAFAGGTIDTIAASAALWLDGPRARIAIAGDLDSNSALVGLTDNEGALDLTGGASATLAGTLNNSGWLQVDGSPGGTGGSTLTIDGALVNGGSVVVGNAGMVDGSTISANAFVNLGTGWTDLYGSATGVGLLSTGSVTNAGLVTVHEGGALDIAGDLKMDSASTLTVESGGTLTTGAFTTVLKTGDFTTSTIDLQGRSFESQYRIVVESGTLEFIGTQGTGLAELTGAGIIQGEVSLDAGTNVLTITPTGQAVGTTHVYHFFHTDLGLAYTEVVAADGSETITGSNRGEVMTGGAFNDAIYGGNGGDTLSGEAGDDMLYGRAGIDTLNGGEGDDRLDGGAGADLMTGGTGNDRYFVDNAADQVFENVGEGTDTVYTKVNYTLVAGQEVEVLWANAGSTGLMLGGNEFDNRLVGRAGNDGLDGAAGNDRLDGNDGDDTLDGGDGDDQLFGGTGSDILDGGIGDDRLDGGVGADTMTGGAGNDLFYVDNAGDQVHEAVGGGTDAVYASVGYSLASGEEIESLRANAGSTGLTLGGNEFDNTVFGATGNDVLMGGAGQDKLYGRDGADTLSGGAGNDRLEGDAGADVFLFDSEFQSVVNIDTVADFEIGIDRIHLDQTYFGGLALGQLSASAFALNKAVGTDAQIIYSTVNGSLTYDSNGTDLGGASVFARVTGLPALTASSFTVV